VSPTSNVKRFSTQKAKKGRKDKRETRTRQDSANILRVSESTYLPTPYISRLSLVCGALAFLITGSENAPKQTTEMVIGVYVWYVDGTLMYVLVQYIVPCFGTR
jgi:hypothetical protein